MLMRAKKSKEEPFRKISQSIDLANGLVGLPSLKKMELLMNEEEAPFMRLYEPKKNGFNFFVVQPCGLVPNYIIEILEEDRISLNIDEASDAIILNIAIIEHQSCEANPSTLVTLNLRAPIVIHRETRIGKQIIIKNYEAYSSRYVLYSDDKK